MIAKLTKALMVVALLAAYASVWPTVCNAWSLLHPFSSDEPAAKKPVLVSAQKPPSNVGQGGCRPEEPFQQDGRKAGAEEAGEEAGLSVCLSKTARSPKETARAKVLVRFLVQAQGTGEEVRQRLAGLHKTDQSVAFRQVGEHGPIAAFHQPDCVDAWLRGLRRAGPAKSLSIPFVKSSQDESLRKQVQSDSFPTAAQAGL